MWRLNLGAFLHSTTDITVEYLKNGLGFRILNPMDDRELRVILPHKYLDELKDGPVSSLSFPLILKKVCENVENR